MSRIAACLVVVCGSTLQSASGAELFFGVPKNMGESINGSASDFAHISTSGKSLYVIRGSNFGGSGPMYYAERAGKEQSWGPVVKMSENINDGANGIPSLTADELSLFYSDTVARYGAIGRRGLGGGDLWFSTRPSVDSEWVESTNLGETVNSRYLDADASISADGLSLFFTSSRPGGSGREDIWMSSRSSTSSSWTEPENLGPIVNSSTPDMVPSISPDGLTLFYEKGDPYPDLWATTRKDVDSDWEEPFNLGPKINTSNAETGAQLSADGSTFYFSRWNHPEFDIFAVELLPFETVPLSTGSEGYSQDFDEALGPGGDVKGGVLPTGWTYSENGTVFENTTNKKFPIGSSVGRGMPVFNAGEHEHSDRALAIGVTGQTDKGVLQLTAEVAEQNATSMHLGFDIEVWDAAKNNVELLGDAALDVTMEIDTGDGFAQLLDFGTVSTGEHLFPPAGEYLNGNAGSNRHHFDSGHTDVDIPAGSTLRIRWTPNLDAQSTGWVYGLDNVQLSVSGAPAVVPLQAGDADQDLDFDQRDLVRVQIASKYLTGQVATWGDGDWNGAPGGTAGSPPTGDGLFDQIDIVAAQQAGVYLAGAYAAIQPNGRRGDGQTSVVYSPATGELAVDAPGGVQLTSINIDSAAGIFTGDSAQNLGGSFDNDSDENVFKATFGSSFGSISFGNVAQAGLSEEVVLGDLSVVGSLAGGGELGAVDLIYVPEPASALLLTVGLMIGLLHIRRFG